jgi:hypothetical protein
VRVRHRPATCVIPTSAESLLWRGLVTLFRRLRLSGHEHTSTAGGCERDGRWVRCGVGWVQLDSNDDAPRLQSRELLDLPTPSITRPVRLPV